MNASTLAPAPQPPPSYAVIVDDDALICMHATDILEQAGFHVLDAPDADAALALLAVRHPEVALLFTDVQMPGTLDGFALARRVAVSWPHISIVVASGHISPHEGAMPEGARFIAKPFSAGVVHDHLQGLLPDGHKPEPLRQKATPRPV